MSDRIPASPVTTPAAARPGRLAKIAVVLALGLGVAGVGAFATTSFSQGFGGPFGHGPDFGTVPASGAADPSAAGSIPRAPRSGRTA